MTDTLWISFAVAAVALLVVLMWRGLEAINRAPAIGGFALYLWLGALVFAPDNPEWFQRMVGGINVTVPDVLCAILATVAVLRFGRGFPRLERSLAWPLAIVGGTLLISYGRGLAGFGLQHATNEFREFFYFLTALAYAISFPFDRLGRRLPLLGVLGGVLLMVIAVLRLSAHGIDIDHRPLPSYGALAIGEAFFLGWFWLRTARQPGLWQWLVISFLPFAFFMLHRSVWMCLLAGLAGLMLADPPGRKKLLTILVLGGMLATLVVGIFFRDKIVNGLDGAVKETTTEDSTFMWRVQGWVALLTPDSGVGGFDLLLGRPMGSGYARKLGDSVLDTGEIEAGVIPHNYYVSMLLRGGVIGLAAFLLLYYRLFAALLRGKRDDPLEPAWPCFLIILGVQLVYYIPYSADFIQGLLLGGAVALACRPREEVEEDEDDTVEEETEIAEKTSVLGTTRSTLLGTTRSTALHSSSTGSTPT